MATFYSGHLAKPFFERVIKLLNLFSKLHPCRNVFLIVQYTAWTYLVPVVMFLSNSSVSPVCECATKNKCTNSVTLYRNEWLL